MYVRRLPTVPEESAVHCAQTRDVATTKHINRQCAAFQNIKKLPEISQFEKSDNKEERKEKSGTCDVCGKDDIESRLLELNECNHTICNVCATNGFTRLISKNNNNNNKLCISDLKCFTQKCKCIFEYNESLFVLNCWLNYPLLKCYEILNVIYYNSMTKLILTDYNKRICRNASQLHAKWKREYKNKKHKYDATLRRKLNSPTNFKNDLSVLINKIQNSKFIMASNGSSVYKCHECNKGFKLHEMVVLQECLHFYCLPCIQVYGIDLVSRQSASDEKDSNTTNEIDNREHEPFEFECPTLVYDGDSDEYYRCNSKLTRQDVQNVLLYGSMGPNDECFKYFTYYQQQLLLNELKQVISSHYGHCTTTNSNISETRCNFVDVLPDRWERRLPWLMEQNKYLRNKLFMKNIKLLDLYYQKYLSHFENAKQSIIDSRRMLIQLRSHKLSENEKTKYVFQSFDDFFKLNMPFCIKVMARALPYYVRQFEKLKDDNNDNDDNDNNNNNNNKKYEKAEECDGKLVKLAELNNEMSNYVHRPIAKLLSLRPYQELLKKCEESLTRFQNSKQEMQMGLNDDMPLSKNK